MAESILAGKSERLVSLDVFRGITIAGMVLVNNPGSWGSMYWPLGHAKWDGWTPTDFVFPFFLFIVGVAMTFSFDRRIREGENKMRIFEQVIRRCIILVLLSFSSGAIWGPKWGNLIAYILLIAGLAFVYADEPIFGAGRTNRERRNKGIGWMALILGVIFFLGSLGEFGSQRIPGVLQRIAACYFFASLIMFWTTWRGRIVWVIGLCAGYWAIMRFVKAPESFQFPPPIDQWYRDSPPDAPYPGVLNGWIDWTIFGPNQYKAQPDPEGLLSTIPAIATTLLGTLTGSWLKTSSDRTKKAAILFAAGLVAIGLGWLIGLGFPINKKIWTSSYVFFTAGWAAGILAICYYLIDIQGWKKWAFPFVILGTNAILVFYLSGLMAQALGKWGLKTWIYTNVIGRIFEDPKNQSLAWALSYVVLWVILTYPLYRKKIFLKI